MLGCSSVFLFNFFLHVFRNSTKTSANSSGWSHLSCRKSSTGMVPSVLWQLWELLHKAVYTVPATLSFNEAHTRIELQKMLALLEELDKQQPGQPG